LALVGVRRDNHCLPAAGILSTHIRTKHERVSIGFFSQIFLNARVDSNRVADKNCEVTINNNVDPGGDGYGQFRYAL
jgi:hypothetical protein